MKKLFSLLIPLIFLFSCEEKTVCAYCTELNTEYSADPFCASQSEVDEYVNILGTYDPTYQNWACSVY
jgi:hypothetical protein